jgi:hypothetical protein
MIRSNYGFAVASMLLAGALSGCAGSSVPYSPSHVFSNSSIATSRSASDAATFVWGRSMMRVSLPGAGCFEAAYPTVAWSRVACVAAPHLPLTLPRRGALNAAVIGDRRDYNISESPRLISTAIGSFPDVIGVKRIRTVSVPALGGGCICGNGTYSLQLNANFFSTAACGKNANCVGWEQLVYLNPIEAHTTTGALITQDWLVRTTANAKPLTCPSKPAGWLTSDGDCYWSSPTITIPTIPIAQLDEISMSLHAQSRDDSAFLVAGTTAYGMKTQRDFMGLSRHWTAAEFNVFGDCCASRAILNHGSTIAVRLEADDGSTAAPTCQANTGETGETNSLSLIAAPSSAPEQKYPSILFGESNAAGGGSPSCDAVASR